MTDDSIVYLHIPTGAAGYPPPAQVNFSTTVGPAIDWAASHAKAIKQRDELRAELAKANGLQGHGESCYYCGQPIDNLAGDPGRWEVGLCHADDPGVVKRHHAACVDKRITERDWFKAALGTLRAEAPQFKAFIDKVFAGENPHIGSSLDDLMRCSSNGSLGRT